MNNLIINEFNKLVKQIKFDINNINNNKEKTKNLYRLQSIQKSLEIISKLDFEIKNTSQLTNIKNIGKGTLKRIDEILKTGKLSEINDIIINNESNYLDYIEELQKIYGIGEKTAIKLIRNYNIKSIDELKNNLHKIDLPSNVLKGLNYINKIDTNIPRINIDKINNYLQNIIYKIDNKLFGIICGSYRRLKPFSSDIDMLLIHPNITQNNIDKNKYFSKFINKLIKEKFIIESFTSTDVTTKYMGLCNYNNNIYRIDIRFIPYESYYYSLLYFTGSKDFNKKMRLAAISLDYILNEYGLYDKDKKLVAKNKIKSELDIFKLLNLEYIDPSHRY